MRPAAKHMLSERTTKRKVSTHRYRSENHGRGRTYFIIENSSLCIFKTNLPSSEVTRFTNRHTTQVGADTKHDKPLWLFRPVLVTLRITQLLPVFLAGLINLALRPVADEHGLAAPLDDDVLPFGNVGKLDFDLREREHIGGRGHRAQELGHRRLRD